MLGADEGLFSIIRRYLYKALAARDLRDAGPFSERVRRLVGERLGGTTITPASVGRALAVSRRTLSRRLAREGTSFRDILNDLRREFGCALLQDHSLSVGDVSFFLQYSELSLLAGQSRVVAKAIEEGLFALICRQCGVFWTCGWRIPNRAAETPE